MTKLTYILFFILFSNLIICQTIHLKDHMTKKEIPFVNMLYYSGDKIIGGDYCDANGNYSINNLKEIEEIEFSCIGYETLIVEKENIKDTIYLNSSEIVLNEIIITNSKKDNETHIGYNDFKKKFSISGSKGIECAVFIENTFNIEKKISSFLFKLEKKNKNRIAVRIHLYKKNDANEPSNELIDSDIIFYINKGSKGQFDVELSSYNLTLPLEGVFIGLEWLGTINDEGQFLNSNEWNNTQIEFNDELETPITYFRNRFKTGIWNDTRRLKKDLEKIIKFTNFPNASFGIMVADK